MRSRLGAVVIVICLLAPLGIAAQGRPGAAGMRDAFAVNCASSGDGQASRRRDRRRDRRRAAAGFAALQRAFLVPGVGLYREQSPWLDGNSYAYLWPYAHALGAAIDMASLPGASARDVSAMRGALAGLDAYWDADAPTPAYASYVRAPYGDGGDLYYDDNVWIGLEFVDVYRLTGDQAALADAGRVFDYMVAGWDNAATDPAPGGVFWVQAGWNRERGTVSTATAALLGFELYAVTHDQRVFDWAWRMYAWTNRSMLAGDGLYMDHVNPDGSLDAYENSYNQGAMIGASVLLYQLTGSAGYLSWAARVADTALARYGAFDGVGAVQPSTNVIFFKDLLLLEGAAGDPRYRAAMQRYADRLWDRAQASPDGLLRTRPDTPAELIDQAALVELYAGLADGSGACGVASTPMLAAPGF